MKTKLLKRFTLKNETIDIWQKQIIQLLPYISILKIRNEYFELCIGWLFWHISYYH